MAKNMVCLFAVSRTRVPPFNVFYPTLSRLMSMKLKALLVDDEINIIKNLEQIIPWERMDIEVIGLAKNGVEALQYVKADCPDILITDIRMPLMDGLVLLQRVREINKDCEIMILTGYQDFDYARSALQFGAKDYILKPIHYGELEANIQRVALEIKARKLKKTREDEKWRSVVHLANEKILFDVLMDYTSSLNASFLLKGEEYDEEDPEYILFLIDVDSYSLMSRIWNQQERKLWNFAVRNVLQYALHDYGLYYAVLQMREGEWCVLIEQQKAHPYLDKEVFKRWAAILQQAVSEFVHLELSVGIYMEPLDLSALSDAYKKVQRSLNLSPQANQIMVVTPDDSESSKPSNSLWITIEAIVSGLKQGNRPKVEAGIRELNANLQAISGQSFRQVERILHFLVLHLLREMREMDSIGKAEEEAIWIKLESSFGAKDLLVAINQLVDECLTRTLGQKTAKVLMLSAEDYIQHHLVHDLGIEEVADYLGISCSYFSLLFKLHAGETFVEYITRHRIELAKSMLMTSDKSVAKIGALIGIADRRYFTKVFQRYTGVKPSEYREHTAKL
jgi:two-component system response regulator YesN